MDSGIGDLVSNIERLESKILEFCQKISCQREIEARQNATGKPTQSGLNQSRSRPKIAWKRKKSLIGSIMGKRAKSGRFWPKKSPQLFTTRGFRNPRRFFATLSGKGSGSLCPHREGSRREDPRIDFWIALDRECRVLGWAAGKDAGEREVTTWANVSHPIVKRDSIENIRFRPSGRPLNINV